MSVSDVKLEQFINRLQENYTDESFIQEYTNSSTYDADENGDVEYVQIGRRVNLPKRYFFQQEASTTRVLSLNFAKSIIRGEKRHILSSIKEQSDTDQISKIESDGLTIETVIRALEEVYEPDYLFLPNTTETRESVTEWYNNSNLSINRRLLSIGQSEVDIEWIPQQLELTGAYLFNKESIEVVQKRYRDVDRPEQADYRPEHDWCHEDDTLMVYFGEEFEGNSDEFDFWFRTIVSEPLLRPAGVCYIDLGESIQPE